MTTQLALAKAPAKPRAKRRTITPRKPRQTVVDGNGTVMGVWEEPAQGIRFPGMHTGPRTKQTHPYSYDPLLVFETGVEATSSQYSDRLKLWHPSEVLNAMLKKHFGNTSESYYDRSAKKIEGFLQDLMAKPGLRLVTIEEHCNQATGYPVWWFAFRTPETVDAEPANAKLS